VKHVSDFQGCAGRTFRQALVGLLEREYGLVGSRRVLEMLADDVEGLIAQHYPVPERIGSGWMVLTATRGTAAQEKGWPGRTAADYELVTLAWPVLMRTDLATLVGLPPGPARAEGWRALQKERIRRLIEHGLNHPKGPAFLTLADLSLLIGLPIERISVYLQEVRAETGQVLPTMGYHFDLGLKPTHKAPIVGLYEAGIDEAEIARRTEHSQASVGHYLRDYERVKLLLDRKTAPEEIAMVTGMSPTVVAQHVQLVLQYHPELAPHPPPST